MFSIHHNLIQTESPYCLARAAVTISSTSISVLKNTKQVHHDGTKICYCGIQCMACLRLGCTVWPLCTKDSKCAKAMHIAAPSRRCAAIIPANSLGFLQTCTCYAPGTVHAFWPNYDISPAWIFLKQLHFGEYLGEDSLRSRHAEWRWMRWSLERSTPVFE